jgi:hypothetical protein
MHQDIKVLKYVPLTYTYITVILTATLVITTAWQTATTFSMNTQLLKDMQNKSQPIPYSHDVLYLERYLLVQSMCSQQVSTSSMVNYHEIVFSKQQDLIPSYTCVTLERIHSNKKWSCSGQGSKENKHHKLLKEK